MDNWREHVPQLRQWTESLVGVKVDMTGLDFLKAQEVQFVVYRLFGRMRVRHYRRVLKLLRQIQGLPEPWDLQNFCGPFVDLFRQAVNRAAGLTGSRRRRFRQFVVLAGPPVPRTHRLRFSRN